MYRQRIVLTAALAAVLALSGCDAGHEPAEPVAAAPVTSTATPEAPASAMPTPEALTDVLYRLSDPEVPGAEKLNLIEGAKPTDADTIAKFATALKDGGYLPLNLEAAGLTWSDRHPGYVSADVTVNTAIPDTGAFALPMEFKPRDGGWQLSRETAKTLLAFGKAHAGSSTPATPAP
ncbi:hypothetical protein [[Mycobacterium] nativiensis]|uniref:Low molecular weight antigen MTB12-like C-terminal domain-containing protein n=1 Tax=[Mycobacterium] nativiensis TaxID=2855503 RepID=A0ABU5XYP4_9MYCO|nr:hypothetical protein [Mycolicibacter sp. MYC340]MEB3033107.1 hypothetical protein [Mycolicibacter sp. MYC340]